MSISATAKWILLALAGLAIAIGVAIAAANLTSQQIGIASESVSAGDSLAPSLRVPAEGKPHAKRHDRGQEEEALPPSATRPEEALPPGEEAAEPSGPAEGGGEERSGHDD